MFLSLVFDRDPQATSTDQLTNTTRPTPYPGQSGPVLLLIEDGKAVHAIRRTPSEVAKSSTCKAVT